MIEGKYLLLFLIYIGLIVISLINFLIKTKGFMLEERNRCLSFKIENDLLNKYGHVRMKKIKKSFLLLFIVVASTPFLISIIVNYI